jgi:hypothetical protein
MSVAGACLAVGFAPAKPARLLRAGLTIEYGRCVRHTVEASARETS